MSIDLENQVNNEKYIECIICFEDIKEPAQKYKYMCKMFYKEFISIDFAILMS